ncbi:hypothetical protein, partial [Brochothrix thermosphacta]|uniref:hypothetical protein n=1 Tax=Brochothrix thermosphacta TaxID=2756 RepID=UPI0039B0C302
LINAAKPQQNTITKIKKQATKNSPNSSLGGEIKKPRQPKRPTNIQENPAIKGTKLFKRLILK